MNKEKLKDLIREVQREEEAQKKATEAWRQGILDETECWYYKPFGRTPPWKRNKEGDKK